MLELSTSICLRQSFDLKQRLGYSQLITLQQTFADRGLVNALKGYEGMQKAHEILMQKNAQGLLIGGLAKSVWNQRKSKEELEQHKDVDVVILNTHSVLEEPFEGGIDWWLPKTATLTIQYEGSTVHGMRKTWYQNENGIILSFGILATPIHRPGLYIPSPTWITDMKVCEAIANIDTTNIDIDIDSDVIERFRGKISRKIGKRVPKYITEKFKDHILEPFYQDNDKIYPEYSIEEFDLETLRAIQSYKLSKK
jgi:hypothetical protein